MLTPEMLDEYIEYIHNGGYWLENKQLQRENRQLQRETYTQNVDFVHKSDQLRDRLHRHLLDRRMSLYPKLRPQPFAVVDATKLWGVPVLEDDRLPKGSWYVVNGVLEITP